jgi:hypothetical protein
MGLLRCFQTDLEDVDDDDNKVTIVLMSEILRMQDYFLMLKKSKRMLSRLSKL